MTEDVVIVGIGTVTAVGLSAKETAASVRAGVARFAQSEFQDKRFQPFTLATVLEDALPPVDATLERERMTARERRLLRLATPALRECLRPLEGRTEHPGLCLALPETDSARSIDGDAFLDRLAVQAGLRVPAAQRDASHRGRAGGIVAVGQAVATLRARRAELMLAGGVDSHRDPWVLGALDAEGRVKSEANLDGFIPGEAAAFLLLARAASAEARGLTPMARISDASVGHEGGHLYSEQPYRGDGLAATLAQLAALGALTVPAIEVYSSMNGESHWGKELGVAVIRNRDVIQSVHRVHHPAESVGDTGAACGPLMMGLAALGMRAGYRRSPSLVYGSSDRGGRAAVVVTS